MRAPVPFNVAGVITTAEDLLIGNGAGQVKRLGVGSNTYVLTVSGGVIGWASPGAPGAHASTHLPGGADALTVGTPSSVGTANAAGSAAAFARQDHVHDIANGAIDAAALMASNMITDVQINSANKDGSSGVASMRTLGTGSTQAAAGNHTHSYASTTHASTHETSGSDPIVNTLTMNNTKGILIKDSGGTARWWLEAGSGSYNYIGDDNGSQTTLKIRAPGAIQFAINGTLEIDLDATSFRPETDNSSTCGANGGFRWSEIWAANGTIQTSKSSEKREIALLDPADALQAILEMDFHTYRMRKPVYETRYKNVKLNQGTEAERTVREGKKVEVGETVHHWRHVGFMAESAHPLLSPDQENVNPQTTASVGLAAIKALARRVELLERKAA